MQSPEVMGRCVRSEPRVERGPWVTVIKGERCINGRLKADFLSIRVIVLPETVYYKEILAQRQRQNMSSRAAGLEDAKAAVMWSYLGLLFLCLAFSFLPSCFPLCLRDCPLDSIPVSIFSPKARAMP